MENQAEAAQRLIANPAFTAKVMNKALTAVVVLGTTTILLGGATLYREFFPKKDRIVASGPHLPLVPLRELTEPAVTRQELLDWARQCAVKVYDLDYVHWREQQQQAQTCFTVDAWNGWAASFQRNINAIAKNQLVAQTPTPLCPARIAGEGILGDRYAWKVQMPIRTVWENQQGQVKDDLLVEMTVVRSEDPEHRRGIAFGQFVSRPWSGECGR